MVALPPQRAPRNAALNQYATAPARPSDNTALDTYEYLYDGNGNTGAILQFPRHGDFDDNYYRDINDINTFITGSTNEDPISDLNNDGLWDIEDLNLFPGSPDKYENISLVYDWRNQLVAFVRSNGADQAVMAEYHYDCFNRRGASIIDSDGDGTDDEITYFIYGGQAAWQLFAEYNGPDSSASLIKSYVYGNYIDEVLQMRDHPSSKDYFYHQDDLFSVYAMTDEAGAVVERYEYGDYAQVSIMAEDGTSRMASLYGNRHTFTGRLLDEELALDDGSQSLQYRHRYMATGSGRFLQRDPVAFIDTNIYSYANNSPQRHTDPKGLLVDDDEPDEVPPWVTPPYYTPPGIDVIVPLFDKSPEIMKIGVCNLRDQRRRELLNDPTAPDPNNDAKYRYYKFLCDVISKRNKGRITCCAAGTTNGPATRFLGCSATRVPCPQGVPSSACCKSIGRGVHKPAPAGLCKGKKGMRPWRRVPPGRYVF